jgi:hypothetical protein
MKRLRWFRFAFLALLPSLVLTPGCGPSLPPLFPVSGKVTLGDKPLTEGQVSLIPEGNQLPVGLTITGQIDSSGVYKIYTAGKEGAPEGKYKVTVVPLLTGGSDGKKSGSLPFNKKFCDPTKTTLVIQVSASPKENAYDLKLTP